MEKLGNSDIGRHAQAVILRQPMTWQAQIEEIIVRALLPCRKFAGDDEEHGCWCMQHGRFKGRLRIEKK